MKKNLHLKLSLLLLFCLLIATGQENKPKVALVLSGGGAKGIAHIPVLQALDSLGIVPDIIIGTSMGAVIGAFYASGYSADSIASISDSTDWGMLFSSNIPISAVSNEEKSEYKRYQVDIGISKGKIQNKTSIISDQNINAFFDKMTYPVNNIKNFDNLPIPFRAVTVDIVNGKEVLLDRGSLSFAMRSTMSIPAVFSPMEYKDVLLIDGGVMNNFPTDIAKQWGADIIIGSDVGGEMDPKEKLDNPLNIVFQSAMLASNLKVPANKKLCDVLIDHTEYITYSTGSFGKNVEIFEQGKIATNKNIAALSTISERLKIYKQTKPILPIVSDEVFIDTIIYKGISKNNMAMFNSRTGVKANQYYTLDQIQKATENALGTNLFDAISFQLIYYKNQLGLKVKAKEKAKHSFKAAFHIDDFEGAGLLLNYTGRNIIGKSSRVLLSIDLAKDFRYRIQYQKKFGVAKDWWFRSDSYGENLEQRTYIDGNYAGDLKSKYLQIDNQINLNIDSFKNYIGLGATYNYNNLKPKIDPEISENNYKITHYNFSDIEVYGQYIHNSLEQLFYPTKGTYFKIKLGTSVYTYMETESLDEVVLPDTNGAVSQFTKLRFNFETRFPLTTKLSAILAIDSGLIYFDDNNNRGNSFDEFGYSANYFLGGNIVRSRNDTFTLPGLEENEVAATQFTVTKLALQYQLFSDIYLTPHVNFGIIGFSDVNNFFSNYINPKGNWITQSETSLLTTAGLTSSYKSFLGPIDFISPGQII